MYLNKFLCVYISIYIYLYIYIYVQIWQCLPRLEWANGGGEMGVGDEGGEMGVGRWGWAHGGRAGNSLI